MVNIFFSTHGKMASGMKNSLDILTGNTQCLTVFDAYITDEPVEIYVEKFLQEKRSGVRILCSDIYGGSVNQVLSRYCGVENTFVITGINLPLLMSLLLSCEQDMNEDTIKSMIVEAKEMIKLVTLDFETNEEAFF